VAQSRDIDPDTWADILAYLDQGARMIDASDQTPAADVVRAITEFAREAKSKGTKYSQDEILALGILLGQQYIAGHGWHWAEVVWDGDEENSAIGVLNSDESLFINPMWWANDVMNTDRAVNFMLNYNMVAAGNMPPGQPCEAVGFH
jgi:hypothetical protein